MKIFLFRYNNLILNVSQFNLPDISVTISLVIVEAFDEVVTLNGDADVTSISWFVS